jgi:hypothetical protein
LPASTGRLSSVPEAQFSEAERDFTFFSLLLRFAQKFFKYFYMDLKKTVALFEKV